MDAQADRLRARMAALGVGPGAAPQLRHCA